MTTQQQIDALQLQVEVLNQILLGQNENFQLLIVHLLNRNQVNADELRSDLQCVLEAHQNEQIDHAQLIPMTAWCNQLDQDASFWRTS